MSHKERMKVIEQEGSGGFALEEAEKLDSATVEKVQDTVDVSEIVAKYDKESAYRTFRGGLEVFIRVLCIALSGFHLFYSGHRRVPAANPARRALGLCAGADLSAVSGAGHRQQA